MLEGYYFPFYSKHTIEEIRSPSQFITTKKALQLLFYS